MSTTDGALGSLTRVHSVLVPGYDDPLLWEGHASMVAEMQRQLPRQPHVIVCNVGGGGLLGGILVGCGKVGWDDGEPSTNSASAPYLNSV